MNIIYSDKQKLHKPRWEWNFGRKTTYPEKNQRVDLIVKELRRRGYGDHLEQPPECDVERITAVHDADMFEHIRACQEMGDHEWVHPHIFPYRTYAHPDTDKRKAGLYCFDVGTQIGKHTFAAAKSAADVAVRGAELIQSGAATRVFALTRPPGHHADYAAYGGYCYFNNVAIAAFMLAEFGRVAILDLDFHHGNGTQNIFYELPNVLVISIHGSPKRHYPYFCGFASECGAGLGRGANVNIPLDAGVDDDAYREHLLRTLERIQQFRARYLVVSMGFDTYREDPAGDMLLTSEFYREIGQRLRAAGPPVLACLEGGYALDALGRNAANFYEGLCLD